jgi:hypothetical protein
MYESYLRNLNSNNSGALSKYIDNYALIAFGEVLHFLIESGTGFFLM